METKVQIKELLNREYYIDFREPDGTFPYKRVVNKAYEVTRIGQSWALKQLMAAINTVYYRTVAITESKEEMERILETLIQNYFREEFNYN